MPILSSDLEKNSSKEEKAVQHRSSYPKLSPTSEISEEAREEKVDRLLKKKNLSLVEMENISIKSTSARFGTWTDLEPPALAESHAGDDGTCRMIFKVPLETLEPGSYSMDVHLVFYNGNGPRWENEVYATIDLG